jgi:hypothetical protein
MFDFAVKGTVVGFYTTMDGLRTVAKVQPLGSPGGLERDERPGVMDVAVPTSAMKNLGANAQVLVRGKGTVLLRETRDKETGKPKLWTNYRFEAESVEVVKA